MAGFQPMTRPGSTRGLLSRAGMAAGLGGGIDDE